MRSASRQESQRKAGVENPYRKALFVTVQVLGFLFFLIVYEYTKSSNLLSPLSFPQSTAWLYLLLCFAWFLPLCNRLLRGRIGNRAARLATCAVFFTSGAVLHDRIVTQLVVLSEPSDLYQPTGHCPSVLVEALSVASAAVSQYVSSRTQIVQDECRAKNLRNTILRNPRPWCSGRPLSSCYQEHISAVLERRPMTALGRLEAMRMEIDLAREDHKRQRASGTPEELASIISCIALSEAQIAGYLDVFGGLQSDRRAWFSGIVSPTLPRLRSMLSRCGEGLLTFARRDSKTAVPHAQRYGRLVRGLARLERKAQSMETALRAP